MTKEITIDGKTMTLRANALLPRQYRYYFQRDLIVDMKKAFESSGKSIKEIEADPTGVGLDALDMTVFENLAWLMLRAGGNDVGANPDEWLASIESPMAFYAVLPAVVELWIANTATTAIPKKK